MRNKATKQRSNSKVSILNVETEFFDPFPPNPTQKTNNMNKESEREISRLKRRRY